MRPSLVALLALADAGAALRLPPKASPGLWARQLPGGPVEDDTAPLCTYFITVTSRLETCEYLEIYWGITHEEFVAWNPSVKDDCSGIKIGNSYCVEVNHGMPVPTSTSTTGTPTPTGTPAPSPTREGTAANCNRYHFAVSGDVCQEIADKYGITFAQFYQWNPSVGPECRGLWAEYWYCVSVTGMTSTTTTGTTPTTTGTPVPSPTREGTATNCNRYHFAVSGDVCQAIADQYGITFAQFYQWNPSVGPECRGLWAQYWYCVSVTGMTTTTTTTSGTTAPSPTVSKAPGPTQSGIVANCRDWYGPVVAGDTCDKILSPYGLTLAQFVQWNPAVGQECMGLWAGYYYCIGTPERPATTRPPTSTTTSPPTPTGCTNANPSPTQPGSICRCSRWHLVQSGNTCWEIFQRYGITQAQFDAWNPGNNCNLWLSYYVCVGA